MNSKNKKKLCDKIYNKFNFWYYLVPGISSSHVTAEQQQSAWKFNLLINALKILTQNFLIGYSNTAIPAEVKYIIYMGAHKKTQSEYQEILKTFEKEAFFIFDSGPECINDSGINLNRLRRNISLSQPIFVIRYLLAVFQFRNNVDMKSINVGLVNSIRYIKLEQFFKQILDERRFVIFNLFPTTNIGQILNSAANNLQQPIVNYSYGSNSPALEQQYAVGDIFCLKPNDDSSKLYPDKEKVVVRDIDTSIIKKQKKLYDLCIIDTCENRKFSSNDKLKILKQIPQLEWMNTIYCWHPGTIDKKIIQQSFPKFCYSNDTQKGIQHSGIILDFGSTLQSVLTRSNIDFISLHRIMSNDFKNEDPPIFFEQQESYKPKEYSAIFKNIPTSNELNITPPVLKSFDEVLNEVFLSKYK